ncbi:unnamed protein product [Chrysoparadoxa australica]
MKAKAGTKSKGAAASRGKPSSQKGKSKKKMRFPCEECGKVFPSRRSHIYHTSNKVCMKNTEGFVRAEPKFKCELCGSGFTAPNGLAYHMKNMVCQEKEKELLALQGATLIESPPHKRTRKGSTSNAKKQASLGEDLQGPSDEESSSSERSIAIVTDMDSDGDGEASSKAKHQNKKRGGGPPRHDTSSAVQWIQERKKKKIERAVAGAGAKAGATGGMDTKGWETSEMGKKWLSQGQLEGQEESQWWVMEALDSWVETHMESLRKDFTTGVAFSVAAALPPLQVQLKSRGSGSGSADSNVESTPSTQADGSQEAGAEEEKGNEEEPPPVLSIKALKGVVISPTTADAAPDLLMNAGAPVYSIAHLQSSVGHCIAAGTGGLCDGLAPVEEAMADIFAATAESATAKKSERFHFLGRKYSGPHLIQVWPVPFGGQGNCSMAYGVPHNGGYVRQLAWAPQGTLPEPYLGLLAAACGDGALRVYTLPQPEHVETDALMELHGAVPVLVMDPVAQLEVEGTLMTCLEWSPHQSNVLLAGTCDGGAIIWNLETGLKRRYQELGADPSRPTLSSLRSVAWCPYARGLFAVSGQLNGVTFWDEADQYTPVSGSFGPTTMTNGCTGLVWSPDGHGVWSSNIASPSFHLISFGQLMPAWWRSASELIGPSWAISAASCLENNFLALSAPNGQVRVLVVPADEKYFYNKKEKATAKGLAKHLGAVVHESTYVPSAEGSPALLKLNTALTKISTRVPLSGEMESTEASNLAIQLALIKGSNDLAKESPENEEDEEEELLPTATEETLGLFIGGFSGLIRCCQVPASQLTGANK